VVFQTRDWCRSRGSDRSLEAAELAHRYFSAAEAKAVDEAGLGRRRAFLRLWSLKEAALKFIGEGLPFGLDAFEFSLTPNLYIVHAPRVHGGPERFDAQVFEASDICAAWVIRSLCLMERSEQPVLRVQHTRVCA
jgi:4'-phosphopantetheinyl transferase